MSEPATINFGFTPLVDCAIPVVAHEMGFAQEEGIRLNLMREASWAAMRDKLAFGVLDAAHILAGIPIASSLGLGSGPRVAMIAPMALGLGGNAITVSTTLYQRMLEAEPAIMAGPRGHSARALRTIIEQDRRAGRPPVSFASVFPVSSHNYELRYWLAAAGIDPETDVNLGVVVPPRMVESLRMGWIDGYCVGEPWNLRAVQQGLGVIVATKADIWANAPDKVLGVREEWAEQNPDRLLALIRACVRAAQWADAPENRNLLADMLATQHYVAAPVELVRATLTGKPVLRRGAEASDLPDRHVFFRWQATFPWRSHALWLLTQMRRWGQLGADVDMRAAAESVYRPDLYRRAVVPLGLTVPGGDWKSEGQHATEHEAAIGDIPLRLGPDIFLDGRTFDPTEPVSYVQSFRPDPGDS